MNTILLALTSLSFNAFAAIPEIVDERPMALESQRVSKVIIETAQEANKYNVKALVNYSNDCNIPDSKVKEKQKGEDWIQYQLYGYNYELRYCPSVYLPIEREILVDTIYLPDSSALPEIEINGQLLSSN